MFDSNPPLKEEKYYSTNILNIFDQQSPPWKDAVYNNNIIAALLQKYVQTIKWVSKWAFIRVAENWLYLGAIFLVRKNNAFSYEQSPHFM